MNIDDFVRNFASLMEDTDTTKFSAQTRFRDDIEEWSSLTALSVIAMVDSEYGVSIKGEDIRKSHTIEDIYNIVKSRK